jgi:ribosome-binding protein aMBF1 (putative translation factor)
MNIKRTLVKDIKPGDLVLNSSDRRELSVVLNIKLLDRNNSVATITFLNSKNNLIQSSGWIILYKINKETNHE